ncbi:unnamed protein product, partial [Mesorhabditis spiculigera]
MSRTTLNGQKKLVKALTIQALLPLFCLSQSGMFIWQQFKLPFHEHLPYYEEAIYLSVAIATVSAQRKLVKALTIQAMLPFAMLTSSPLFLWEQFQLPFVEYVPYYEEWGFLSLALTSVISPLVTIYYVLPYRRWIMKLFCKTKRLGPTTANYAPTNASTLKATEGSNLMDQLI